MSMQKLAACSSPALWYLDAANELARLALYVRRRTTIYHHAASEFYRDWFISHA